MGLLLTACKHRASSILQIAPILRSSSVPRRCNTPLDQRLWRRHQTGIPTYGCASLLKMSAFPALLPLLTRKQTSHLRLFGLSQPASNFAATKLFQFSVQVPPPPVPSNTNPATTRLAPSAPLRVSQSVETGVYAPVSTYFPT